MTVQVSGVFVPRVQRPVLLACCVGDVDGGLVKAIKGALEDLEIP